jgi:hypothetical protein
MEYVKVSEMAKRWGLSSRRVRVLCAEGKVEGVIRKGNLYLIPENASKPADGRATRSNDRSTTSFRASMRNGRN